MPAVARQLADLKSVEGEELITSANPEGYVSVAPKVVDAAPLTIVSQRVHDGFGGPLSVEVGGNRGLSKALGGDGIFELSNGGKYVLPLELATAIGAAIPPDPPVALMEAKRRAFYGQDTEEDRELIARGGEDLPPGTKAEYVKDAKTTQVNPRVPAPKTDPTEQGLL